MIRSNMADAELIATAADIGESNCSLNHGPGTKASDYPAVNALVIPIGRRINEVESEEVRKLTVPVCAECAESLSDDAWTLILCVECSASQWIHRASAKMGYRHHLILLKGCPGCGGKFEGIYFQPNEFENAPSEDM